MPDARDYPRRGDRRGRFAGNRQGARRAVRGKSVGSRRDLATTIWAALSQIPAEHPGQRAEDEVEVFVDPTQRHVFASVDDSFGRYEEVAAAIRAVVGPGVRVQVEDEAAPPEGYVKLPPGGNRPVPKCENRGRDPRSVGARLPRPSLPLLLYHGTSRRSWASPAATPTTLYLAVTAPIAAAYAFEEAARDELEGLPPEPVIVVFSGEALAQLVATGRATLHPDWGAYGVTEHTTWAETLSAFGSLAVVGDPDEIDGRAMLRIEPAI